MSNLKVSSYASTLIRTTKPFNPLLGETYELDRVEEMGLRLIVEQGIINFKFIGHDFRKNIWQKLSELTINKIMIKVNSNMNQNY